MIFVFCVRKGEKLSGLAKSDKSLGSCELVHLKRHGVRHGGAAVGHWGGPLLAIGSLPEGTPHSIRHESSSEPESINDWILMIFMIFMTPAKFLCVVQLVLFIVYL